jgi:hypothetical protein
MVLRWIAAGMGEARQQFRRANGCLHLPALRAALDATIATVTPHQGGCRRLIGTGTALRTSMVGTSSSSIHTESFLT